MKNLRTFLEDAGCNATPGNTMGMGNPHAPGPDGETGSEPLPTAKAKRKKKKKSSEEE